MVYCRVREIWIQRHSTSQKVRTRDPTPDCGAHDFWVAIALNTVKVSIFVRATVKLGVTSGPERCSSGAVEIVCHLGNLGSRLSRLNFQRHVFESCIEHCSVLTTSLSYNALLIAPACVKSRM